MAWLAALQAMLLKFFDRKGVHIPPPLQQVHTTPPREITLALPLQASQSLLLLMPPATRFTTATSPAARSSAGKTLLSEWRDGDEVVVEVDEAVDVDRASPASIAFLPAD
jgi:hypothetical protein